MPIPAISNYQHKQQRPRIYPILNQALLHINKHYNEVSNVHYILTPKQLEDFNARYGNLKGESYLVVLRHYERKYGFRSEEPTIN